MAHQDIIKLKNAETNRYVFCQGDKNEREGAEGGWIQAKTQNKPLIGADANYYNRAMWEVEKRGDIILLRNHETKRLIFDQGPKFEGKRGEEGGWIGTTTCKALSADANYYNRAMWRVEHNSNGTKSLINAETNRMLFDSSERFVGKAGDEGGWVGKNIKPIVTTDANYYNRAMWIFEAPEKITNSESDNLVRKSFPTALVNQKLLDRIRPVLDKYKFTSENTLFAHSTCADEINQEIGDITQLLTTYLGEMFIMGGLGGVPFCGKTGFSAFSHHVPSHGNIFILYAPHVGIASSVGKCGYYVRKGQTDLSTACGAAIGAYNAVAQEPSKQYQLSDDDYQMDFIKREIQSKYYQDIAKHPEPMVKLAHSLFHVVDDYLHRIINLDWAHGEEGGKMILLGGIQINLDGPYTDYFLPLKFDLLYQNKTTGATITEDLLPLLNLNNLT